MNHYYILLADKVATQMDFRLCSLSDQDTQVPVKKGSLWTVKQDSCNDNTAAPVDLYSVDTDGVVLKNFLLWSEEIQKLPKEHFDLLFAVSNPEQRFNVFQDKQWLAEATHLEPGSVVYLINLEGFPESKIPGKVRYRGPLPYHNGTWFGVELTAKYRGKGTSDGIFRKSRYFTCHMDSAVFKPISKLTYCPDPSEYVQSPIYDATPEQLSKLPPPPPLTLGERVIWISDKDEVERATVKWIGALPDDNQANEWMVGVEFDNRVGTGTGKYKNQQLFRTNQGYASLMPVMGLIKDEEYRGRCSSPSHMRNNRPSLSSDTHTSPTLTPLGPLSTPRQETFPSSNKKRDTYAISDYLRTYPVRAESSVYGSSTTELYNVHTTDQHTSQSASNNMNSGAKREPVEATQDHLNHFNDHGNFSIHSSLPIQVTTCTMLDIKGVATTDRPIPNKYKQQDRYNKAVGLDPPPCRPEKHILEKDPKSIYDLHPYENIKHDTDMNRQSDDIYEQVMAAVPQHRDFDEADNWNDLPLNTTTGELIRQPAYKSSIDIRPAQAESFFHHGRFTMGSANGLDTQTHLPSPENKAKPLDSNMALTELTSAAARRANYQHSNTDPLTESTHGTGCLGFHGSPSSNRPSETRHPDGTRTEPRPHNLKNIDGLTYANLHHTKSSRARSVDDIFKGIEHGLCPRITGNSVFYDRPLANEDYLDETYKQLLHDENPSSVTTPSSYVTAQENLTQLGGSSLNSSTRHPQSSSCNDTYDSEAYTTPDEFSHWHDMQYDSKTYPGSAFDQLDRFGIENRSHKAEVSATLPHTNTTSQAPDVKPVSMTPQEANTDLELGSTVEVEGNKGDFKYGVVRWIGHFGDKRKPLVGLEMEVPNNSCTDGTFGRHRPFTCPPKKGFYVYLNKVKKDSRFQESPEFSDRSLSQVFGSLECDDIPGDVIPPASYIDITKYIGRNRGIQGHHNSCYMDATLFSMFAFSTAFDDLLKPKAGNSVNTDRVQLALRQGIVNPLRKSFYVRADKVMNLRCVLHELNRVEGLTHAEKDPEEFLNCLLDDALKAEPFMKLSSGLQSCLYQMILEKDCHIILPSTQQLLGLSFLQANLKLLKVPKILLLQMPRCGKKYKMYPRIVPSLNIDITDILHGVPRECAICSGLATYECRDCFKHFGDGSLLEISFCEECLRRCHSNPRRARHSPVKLAVTDEMIARYANTGKDKSPIPRVKLQLSAIICIETSHYVAIVRAGYNEDSPWLFFDSMADRMGEQHGYNVPEVKLCRELPEWLLESGHEKILSCKDDRDLPEPIKRAVSDGYICFYESLQTT